MKIKTSTLVAACIVLLLGNCTNDHKTRKQASAGDISEINADSVLFSFVFMGCNRIDWKDTANINTNASTANVPELRRTFNEVSRLHPKPDLFFFLGDLVLGLDKDPAKLRSQLNAWVAQYKDPAFSPIASSGIRMIAVPGNHEMLFMNSNNQEVPWQGALPVWASVMSSFRPEGKINTIPAPNDLNNRETYSFTYKNTHFILVNTDTYNPELKIGQAPASWINSDIAAARNNPAVEHIFLLGHKPSYVDAPITDPAEFLDTTVTNTIWPVMEKNRVEAMLSAHSHQYYRTQPHAGKSYQVIAGNGGSKYEKHLDTEDQFYGYSVIYIMKNGEVRLRSMGRSVPDKDYLESVPDSLPTLLRDEQDISWGTTAPAWITQKKK